MPQTIYPALHCADADAMLAFLENAFGGRVSEVHRDAAGAVRHAEVVVAGSVVMLGQVQGAAGSSSAEGRSAGKGPISLYVVVEDPDAHHATAVAAGATVVRAPEDMEYGSREYGARDPEGNLWSFGTYDPTVAS